MALFQFGKSKNNKEGTCGQEGNKTCGCNAEHAAESTVNSRFIVLGACCKKSADTFANAKQAVKELGLPDEVINVGDAAEIAKYGVMQTPALVINGKVVSYGRMLSTADIKAYIEQSAL